MHSSNLIFVCAALTFITHCPAVKSDSNTSTICGLGKYATPTGCQLCPFRTFSDTKSNDTECKQCPDDTYTFSRGVVSSRLCLVCPLASTSSGTDTKCKPCPKNTVGRCGRCVHCPPGTYINRYYRCHCFPCPYGEISPLGNSYLCEKCPENLVSNVKRTRCTTLRCPPGYAFDGFSCRPCEGNTYRNGTMQSCEECPNGTVTNSTSGPNKNCITCPPGMYISDFAIQTKTYNGVPLCLDCPINSTTRGYGKRLCRAHNSACPPNSFKDRDDDCQICDYNYYVHQETLTCKPCPNGYTAPRGSAQSCSKCPRGMTASDEGQCVCKPGHMFHGGQCKACPAGTTLSKNSDFESCAFCDDGYIASRPGSLECSKCPEGTSTVGNDRTRCVPAPTCPNGFVYSFPIHVPVPIYIRVDDPKPQPTCVSARSGCPHGLRAAIRNGASVCVNSEGSVICPPGTIYDNDTECIVCGPTTYVSKETGSSKLSCQFCPGSSFSTGRNVQKCTRCPKGFIALPYVPKFFTCYCPHGKYIQSDGACVKCPEGSFSDPSDPHKCRRCSKGFSLIRQNGMDRCSCKIPMVINSTGFCVQDFTPSLNYLK